MSDEIQVPFVNATEEARHTFFDTVAKRINSLLGSVTDIDTRLKEIETLPDEDNEALKVETFEIDGSNQIEIEFGDGIVSATVTAFFEVNPTSTGNTATAVLRTGLLNVSPLWTLASTSTSVISAETFTGSIGTSIADGSLYDKKIELHVNGLNVSSFSALRWIVTKYRK